MTTGQWIAIVVGVLIVLIIIGVVVRMGRKRKVAADQAKAGELRRDAERARLDASEHAANAATADARAQQARVEAEKLRLEADARAGTPVRQPSEPGSTTSARLSSTRTARTVLKKRPTGVRAATALSRSPTNSNTDRRSPVGRVGFLGCPTARRDRSRAAVGLVTLACAVTLG